jgi:hypothetical protein
MKKAFIIVVYLVVFDGLFAQSPSAIQTYIDQYKSLALEQEKLYGIPAPITLAQGLLESTAGTSLLAINANNHFGVKALGGWSGGIYRAWDDEPSKSKFRVYKSVEESFTDHSKILKNNSRYQSLFSISVYDYRSWANGLQKAGYATSKDYAKALIGYIDAYKLYSINGGVKLKPKKKTIPSKATKAEELTIAEDYGIDASEKTEEEEEVTRTLQRFVVEINEVRCTILYPGETLSSISMKYDIPKNKILDYNETASEADIHEGDIVYLEKKKRKFYGPQDFYRVKAGDSLFSIAQQFGIRTSSLAKMNQKDLFSPLVEGEKLYLK